MYDWKVNKDAPIRDTLAKQESHTLREFEKRTKESFTQLMEQGLNVALYWENPDVRTYVNVVPTSAITGEGLPDVLFLLLQLTQTRMVERLMFVETLQCSVLEVKVIEGLGTTVDVILVNGTLHEGDTIVIGGLQGPIVTPIRALLTPHPMREMRVKGQYIHHKEMRAAMGVKITAQGLEHAVAGTNLVVVGPDDDVEELKEEAQAEIKTILQRVDKSGVGVYVQASTLGSLEALLDFLSSPAVNIPVANIALGPVHKRDIVAASVMLERKRPEYATLLAFDVPVTKEAKELAEELNVRIFTADIIYHLFDQFTAFINKLKDDKRHAAALVAVFPCVLKIMPSCIFNKVRRGEGTGGFRKGGGLQDKTGWPISLSEIGRAHV